MALTINQEKKIRKERERVTPAVNDLPQQLMAHRLLAKKVALYRRAQKLPNKDGADLCKSILGEIDALLAKLGL